MDKNISDLPSQIDPEDNIDTYQGFITGAKILISITLILTVSVIYIIV